MQLLLWYTITDYRTLNVVFLPVPFIRYQVFLPFFSRTLVVVHRRFHARISQCTCFSSLSQMFEVKIDCHQGKADNRTNRNELSPGSSPSEGPHNIVLPSSPPAPVSVMSGVQTLRFRRPIEKEKNEYAPKPVAARHTGILQDQLRRCVMGPQFGHSYVLKQSSQSRAPALGPWLFGDG